LSHLVAIFGCWLCVAEGDLLTFLDGSPCPDHKRGAVHDLVRVSVAAVVNQTEGQVHTLAHMQICKAGIFSIVVGLEGVNVCAVKLNYH
jgi:hypothetical protein